MHLDNKNASHARSSHGADIRPSRRKQTQCKLRKSSNFKIERLKAERHSTEPPNQHFAVKLCALSKNAVRTHQIHACDSFDQKQHGEDHDLQAQGRLLFECECACDTARVNNMLEKISSRLCESNGVLASPEARLVRGSAITPAMSAATVPRGYPALQLQQPGRAQAVRCRSQQHNRPVDNLPKALAGLPSAPAVCSDLLKSAHITSDRCDVDKIYCCCCDTDDANRLRFCACEGSSPASHETARLQCSMATHRLSPTDGKPGTNALLFAVIQKISRQSQHYRTSLFSSKEYQC